MPQVLSLGNSPSFESKLHRRRSIGSVGGRSGSGGLATARASPRTLGHELPEGAGQLQTDEMIDAVISGSELSILDITEKVLREDRVASPEAVRDVDAPSK